MSDIVAQDVELVKIAERIREKMKRTAQDIIEIGRDLIAAKEHIGHGGFGEWLEAEFQMSEQAARNFIHVAERFGSESTKFVDFNPSILYMLAAPSTPDPIVEQVTSGAIPATTAAVKEAIAKAKAAEAKAAAIQQQLVSVRAAADEKQEEYEAAQERIKSLTRTIEAIKKEQSQVREKIVEKPDPKQAKRIAELEKQAHEAQRRLKELQDQAKTEAPERQIRQDCQRNASNAANLLRQAVSLVPEQRDTYAFGATEWRALEIIEHIAQQIVSSIQSLRSPIVIVDAE
jgi:hypothetical protein